MRVVLVALALVAFLAACQGKQSTQVPTPTPEPAPTATTTPEPVIPIEIINGEIWVEIPIEGME